MFLTTMPPEPIPKRALLAPQPRSSTSTSYTESNTQRTNNLSFDKITVRKSKAARAATKRKIKYLESHLHVWPLTMYSSKRIRLVNGRFAVAGPKDSGAPGHGSKGRRSCGSVTIEFPDSAGSSGWWIIKLS